MNSVYTVYQMLLDRFLNKDLSADEFKHIYLNRFKNERRELGERCFCCLINYLAMLIHSVPIQNC